MYTVTRLDAIFRYPDRVSLTHFDLEKKFLACGPEFSVDFSVPPEFSGGVMEKYLSTGWARIFDLQLGSRYSTTAPLHPCVQLVVFLAGIFQPFL